MSSAMLRQLEMIVELLEKLPQRMCEEIDKHDSIKKAQILKELTTHMQVLRINDEQIIEAQNGK